MYHFPQQSFRSVEHSCQLQPSLPAARCQESPVPCGAELQGGKSHPPEQEEPAPQRPDSPTSAILGTGGGFPIDVGSVSQRAMLLRDPWNLEGAWLCVHFQYITDI